MIVGNYLSCATNEWSSIKLLSASRSLGSGCPLSKILFFLPSLKSLHQHFLLTNLLWPACNPQSPHAAFFFLMVLITPRLTGYCLPLLPESELHAGRDCVSYCCTLGVQYLVEIQKTFTEFVYSFLTLHSACGTWASIKTQLCYACCIIIDTVFWDGQRFTF